MLKQREVVLAVSTIVALSAGLNYLFSAYAPQLASRLRLTSTQTNAVGAAGNMGVYLSSPIIGRIVDRRGPRPLLIFSAFALTAGYLIIRAFYLGGHAEGSLFATFGVPGLVFAELLTGIGSTAGLSSAGNTVAKSYKKRRAAALSIVLSGFGLSAFFYSTLSSLLLNSGSTRRDTTPSFLLLIAIGCFVSMFLGVIFVRPAPEAPTSSPASTEPVEPTESTPLVNPESEPREDLNVSGWALFKELDFYLIFLYNGLCSGVGLCYINNLGTVLRSLATTSPSSSHFSHLDLARTQSHLVSLLSIFNFLGRLCSGFGSDYFVHHKKENRRISRVWWMLETASVLTLSQVFAYRATSVYGWSGLVLPTIILGFAHGSLFGISGIIGLERFGMKNFSGTNGILALAPALFGQTTNLIFGKIYDSRSHPSTFEASSRLYELSKPAIQCLAGRECYAPAFRLTIGMAVSAMVVAIWLASGRQKMKRRAV
ncbi:uncharacterized protein JCM6883_003827 [Sporobolomyces salmoneus]|uniref:uncharacterized protein n=1 Tax=Sporobolomyces salmoneus TaxID=183962 RepID=UPI0031746F97